MKNKSMFINIVASACVLLAVGVRAAYSDFSGTPTNSMPSGWGVEGSWTRSAAAGMVCTATSGSITNTQPTLAGSNFVVSVKMSVSSASVGTMARMVCVYLDGSGTEENVITNLPTTASIFTFYPIHAAGKQVLIRVELSDIVSGRAVSLAYCYFGESWEYGTVFSCATGIGNDWDAGTPNANWANDPGKHAFQADVTTLSVAAKNVVKPRYQFRPPLSDNIVITFDIYNEPNNGIKPNDYIQFFTHTNSWIGGSVAGVAIGKPKPRYLASETANDWRKETVTGYVPGISGINTFQIGVEAQPGGGSSRYIYIRNIQIKFKTNLASDGAFWGLDGVISGKVGNNTLTFGQTNGVYATAYPRPVGDVSNLVTRVYRQALNRNTDILVSDLGSAIGTNRCEGLDLPIQEAGETNLVRIECTYLSLADFETDSPQQFPAADEAGGSTIYTDASGTNWYVDVVQNKGTVWVNELCNAEGNTYVEVASHQGRTIPTDTGKAARWSVAFDNGTQTNLPVHQFTDDVNGVGFLTLPIPENIPVSGTVRLLNAVGVCEFSKTYDLSATGVWGAGGNGPYATNLTGRTAYETNFVYTGLEAPTRGTTNLTQGFEAFVGFGIQVEAVDRKTLSSIPYSRITVQSKFTRQDDNKSVLGVTLPNGKTTNMIFVGRNASTNAVEITMTPAAFGFYADPIATNVTLVSSEAPFPTNQLQVSLDAGPGIETFDLGIIPSYWEQVLRFTGTSPIMWEINSGRARADCSTYAAGNSSVLKTINGLSANNKRIATVSLTTRNDYSGTKPADIGTPILSTNSTWTSATPSLIRLPSFRNRYDASNPPQLPNASDVFYNVAYQALSPHDFSNYVYVGVQAMAGGGSSRYIYVDNLRVAFQDMLLIKNPSLRIHAKNIADPVKVDVWADLELWGTNVTRVVPSLVWRKQGASAWTTNSLVTCLDTNQTPGIVKGAQALGTFKDVVGQDAGVITVTNSTRLAATNIVLALTSSSDKFEYYLQVSYDPDDADPTRKNAGLVASGDFLGALKVPETRFAPDNAVTSNNTWSAIGLAYSYKPLTNTLNGISTRLWINEVSRGNGGASDDFIELAGPATTVLTGWRVEVVDLATWATVQQSYALSGSPTLNPTNGFGFYLINASSIPALNLPTDGVGVTLYDAQSNVVSRLAFGGSASGFYTAVSTNAASWIATGRGNPGNRQYTWTGSDTPTQAGVNPGQELANGGPEPMGLTTIDAVTTTTLSFTVAGALDADGVSTNSVSVRRTLDNAEVASRVFAGSTNASFVASNLSQNVKYQLVVTYRDPLGNPNVVQGPERYTLLETPPAPDFVARTASSVTLTNSVPGWGQGLTALAFRKAGGSWTTASTNEAFATIEGLDPDATYNFESKGWNGDGIETVAGPSRSYTTMPNPPTRAPSITGAPEWEPWLQIATTHLTNGVDAYFHNPTDTVYAIRVVNATGQTNWLTNLGGLLRGTNSSAAATLLTLDGWNGLNFYVDSTSNQVALAAAARDNHELTETGLPTNAVVSLKTQLSGASVVPYPEAAGQVVFTNKFMNPILGAATEMALKYSVSNYTGGGWSSEWQTGTLVTAESLIPAGPAAVLAGKTVSNVTGAEPLSYTNVIRATWNAAADLPAGHYRVKVKAEIRDTQTQEFAENEYPHELFVDTLAPVAWFNPGTPAYIKSRTAQIIMGSAGMGDAVQWRYRLAGQSEIAWTAVPTQTVTVAADGTYTNLVWARDAAGNEQAAPSTNIWRADITAPLISEFRIVPVPLISQWQRVQATNFDFRVEVDLPALFGGGSDSNAVFRYRFNGGVTSDLKWSSSTQTVGSAAGGDVTNRLEVWAYDWLTNGASSVKDFIWIVDTVAPVARMTVTPQSQGVLFQTNTAWTVRVTNDAQVVAYRWTLNDGTRPAGGDLTTNQSFTVSGLANGSTNTLRVWGCDEAGNWQVSAETDAYTRIVDTSAPMAVLWGYPPAYTTQTVVRVGVTNAPGLPLQDTVARYRWQLAGPTPVAATEVGSLADIVTPTLSEGAYTNLVWGYDPAGNRQVIPTAVSWTVDTTAPTPLTADFANRPLPTDLNTNVITFVMVTNTPLNAVRWDYVVTNAVGATITNVVNCPTNRFNVTVPADGFYGINVWATDQAGNRQAAGQPTHHEWEVDSFPPLFVVTGIPPFYTKALSASVMVTNSVGVARRDTVAYWSCVLNGTTNPVRPAIALAGGAVSNLTGFIQNATNTLYIWASDPAGNWTADSAAFVTNWYVDTTVPVAWFNPGAPAYINARTASVTMGSAGPLDAVQWRYRLAGQSEIAWTAVPTQTVTVAADGTYTNLVWARDTAGNVQLDPSTNIWRADTTAPLTSEFRIVPVPLISQWQRVQATNFDFRVEVDLPALFGGGSDTNATYRYRLNAGTTTTNLSVSWTGTVFSAAGGDVTNRLEVWAYDWLGNSANNARDFIWIVDTVAPVARMTVTPQSQGGLFQTNTAWTARVTNDAQVVAYRWTLNDGTRPVGGDLTTNQSFTVSGLANGSTNTLRVWGCDEAGNWQVSAEADAYSRIVDTSVPVAVLWGYPPAYTTQTVVRVGVTNAPGLPLQETVERYRWQLVGPTPVAPTEVGSLADIVTPTLSEGVYTNLVWGYDPAGNRQVIPTSASWTVDTTSPTPLTADFANRPLPTDLSTNTITFVMVTNTPLNAVRWDYTVTNSLGAAVVSVVNCTTNRFTVTVPAEDTYGIRVWATDQAGNRQAVGQPTTHTWEADISAPPVVLVGVPAPYTLSTSAAVYATNAVNALRRDQLTQWVGVLDGGASPARPAFSLTVGSVTNFTGLADGTHSLHAWACDRSGNWTTDGAAYVTNWVVDTVAPVARFIESVPAYVNVRTVRIIMGSTGRVDAVQWRYRLAGQSEIAWTAVPTQTVTVAADGTYTNLVWARDAAGNEQAAPSTNIWRADITAPLTSEFRIVPVPLISQWQRVQATNFAFRVEVDLPALFGGGSDSNAVFRYRFNGGVTSDLKWSSSTQTVGSAAGGDVTNRLEVWAYDWLTNGASSVKDFIWIVDTVAPVARMTVTPQSQGGLFQTNTTWTARVTNDAQVVAYRWTLNDGTRPVGGDLTTNQSFSVSGLVNGSTNTLRVWGCDAAGNWQVSAEADAYTRIVDTSAPVAVLWGYPPAYTNQTVVRVGVTNAPGLPLQDTVERYRWQLVGPTPVAPIEVGSLADIVTPTLSEGVYTKLVWGYDPAGNRQVIPTAASWAVDTTAPTPLTADFANRPLPTDLNTNAITFVMVTNTPLNAVRWDYTVTNSLGIAVVSVVNCPSNSFTVTLSSADTYGIRVWAFDQAGNRQAVGQPTTHTWEMDFSAPPVVLVGVPEPFTQSTNASVYATNAVNAFRRDQLTQWVGVLDGGASPARPAFSLTVGAVTNFTSLADGTHTLHAWACDRSGNWTANGAAYVTNWVVDTVAPVAQFAVPVPAYTNSRTARIIMGSTGRVDAVQWRYRLAGQSEIAWTAVATQTVTVAADGTYTNLVWARDAAGNEQGAPTTNVWRSDTTAPLANEFRVIPEPLFPQWKRFKATNFLFRVEVDLPALFSGGSDSNATYRYQFKTGLRTDPVSAVQPVATKFTVVSAEGDDVTNTVTVWTSDWLGNGLSVSNTFTWIVDTIEPVAAFRIDPAATDATWQTNRTWTGTVTGDTQTVSYQYTLDGGAATNVVASTNVTFTTPLLSEGWHTVSVWGRDSAENLQSEPTEYTRFVDVTPPAAVLTGYPVPYTTQTWARVSVTNTPGAPAQDTVTRYRWQLALNGVPLSGVSGDVSVPTDIAVTNLADGVYTLSVWGRDPAGNLATAAASVQWTVDTLAPSAAFVTTPPTDINTNVIVFVLATNPPLGAVSWRFAVTNALGGTVTNAVTRDNRIAITVPTDGTYGIWLKASDEAGNEQADVLAWTWEVDRVAVAAAHVVVSGVPQPYTKVDSALISVTNVMGAARRDTVVEWSWALNGVAPSRPAFSLPGGAVTNVTGFVPDAINTLYVWVRDFAGNWTTAAVTTNWFEDKTPPVAVFVQKPPRRVNSPTNMFEMAASGPLGAERWTYVVTNAVGAQVAGGTSVTPTFFFTLLGADGAYTIYVTAYDRAGNPSVEPASYTWTLDRNPPTARFAVTPVANGLWQTNTAWNVSVTGEVDVVAYCWSLDSAVRPAGNETPISSPEFTVSDLSQVEHTLYVWGRDEAGNWQTAVQPYAYTATVDTQPPTAVLVNVPADYMRGDTISVGVTNAAGMPERDTVTHYRWMLTRDGATLFDWSGVTAISTALQAPLADDGDYKLSVIGQDPAGNWQSTATGMVTVTSWIRDTVAPTAWFLTPIPAFTNNRTASFTMGSSNRFDAVAWKFWVVGVTNATADWSSEATHTVTVPDTGVYTNLVWGRDAAGNEQVEPTTNIWRVDVTAPRLDEIQITPWYDSVRTNLLDYSFGVRVALPEDQGGGTDTNAFYEWSLNGSAPSLTPVGVPLTFTSQSGSNVFNTLTVWAYDASLNKQTNGVTQAWFVDTEPPLAAFDPAPPTLTASFTNVFTLVTNGTDAVRWRCQVTGPADFDVTVEIPSNTLHVLVPQDGEYHLSVFAWDAAGNQSAELTWNWTVDTTPPDAIFAAVPGTLVNTAKVAFTVSNDLDSVRWTYRVFNEAAVEVTSGGIAQPTNDFEVTVAADGRYVIELIGHDLAGNFRATPVLPGGVHTWVRDMTQPTNGARFVTAQMPRDPTNLTSVVAVLEADADIVEWLVTLSKLDAGGTVWTPVVTGMSVTNLNGGMAPTAAAVYTFATDGSDDGTYKLEAVARDAAFNWNVTPAEWIWRSDCTKPVATWDPEPASLVASLRADFTVAASTDAVAWRYEVAGVTSGVSPSRSFSVMVPRDGTYTIDVRACDAAGNVQLDALTWEWRADTTRPVPRFAQPLPQTPVNTNTLTFAVADDGDTVAWRYVVTNAVGAVIVTNAVTQPNTPFAVMIPWTEGVYVISLFGRDLAGNESTNTEFFAWELDTTPPSGAMFKDDQMPPVLNNLTPVVSVMAADGDIATWRMKLYRQNGTNWTQVGGSLLVTNVNGGAAPTVVTNHTFMTDGTDDGVYRLTAEGCDAANNWQSVAPDVWEWTFDRTPPVAIFDGYPDSPTQDTETPFVASNRAENVVSWRYHVRKGLTGSYSNWVETTDSNFSVENTDGDGTFTIELIGCDAAGNWQSVVDPDRGQLTWSVSKVSKIVKGSVIRNTVATNGNLYVEVVINLTNDVYGCLLLTEKLPVSVAVTNVWAEPASALTNPNAAQNPALGTVTNVICWSLDVDPGVRQVVLHYWVPNLVEWRGIEGTLEWLELDPLDYREQGMRQLEVSRWRGTHIEQGTEPVSGYSAWASSQGLLGLPDGKGEPGADADGDGVSNQDEYRADTDPKASGLLFKLTAIQKSSDPSLRLQIYAGPNACLAFSWKPSLTGAVWTPVTPTACTYDTGLGVWLAEFPVLPGGLPAQGAFFRAEALARP